MAVAALLFAACAATAPRATLVFDKEPQLGAIVPLRNAPSQLWLTAPSQMSPSYVVSFNGIRYVIALDALDRIRYIETTDDAFRTRDGLRVGASEADVLAAAGQAAVEEPGFGRYSHLQSGWNAHYGVGDDAQTVISFFKRQ
jgi:hypothetical protein